MNWPKQELLLGDRNLTVSMKLYLLLAAGYIVLATRWTVWSFLMDAETSNRPQKEWAFMFDCFDGCEQCVWSRAPAASLSDTKGLSSSQRDVFTIFSWLLWDVRLQISNFFQTLHHADRWWKRSHREASRFLPLQQLHCSRHCCHLSCITWLPDKGGLSGYVGVSRQQGCFLATAKSWKMGVGCVSMAVLHDWTGWPPFMLADRKMKAERN